MTTSELGEPAAATLHASMTLLRRVVLTNAAVLAAATAVLALSPLTISARVAINEGAVLAVYVLVTSLANAVLLRRAFDPLDRLTQLARTADPLRPGTRVAVGNADSHVTELSQAMNDMLARLEDERRSSGRRALAAQEDERRRIARELHDEVGQSLTAVLLQLEAAGHRVPADVARDLEETREAARRSLEDVRAIARRLRPDALDDLGLRSALAALVGQRVEPAGLRVRARITPDLPVLPPEAQVVVYRVAQEALTNVRRHAGAHEATLDLDVHGDRLILTVRDDGVGLPADALEGAGIRGMREPALLVDASLSLSTHTPRGTEVRLELPSEAAPTSGAQVEPS